MGSHLSCILEWDFELIFSSVFICRNMSEFPVVPTSNYVNMHNHRSYHLPSCTHMNSLSCTLSVWSTGTLTSDYWFHTQHNDFWHNHLMTTSFLLSDLHRFRYRWIYVTLLDNDVCNPPRHHSNIGIEWIKLYDYCTINCSLR